MASKRWACRRETARATTASLRAARQFIEFLVESSQHVRQEVFSSCLKEEFKLRPTHFCARATLRRLDVHPCDFVGFP